MFSGVTVAFQCMLMASCVFLYLGRLVGRGCWFQTSCSIGWKYRGQSSTNQGQNLEKNNPDPRHLSGTTLMYILQSVVESPARGLRIGPRLCTAVTHSLIYHFLVFFTLSLNPPLSDLASWNYLPK